MAISMRPENKTPNEQWLQYANQGATRNKPLSSNLTGAMDFLGPMGVTMQVYSGGQDAEGPARVGSTRHDHGDAADALFFQNGRQLDWANPEDQPIFQSIVSQARNNGVTGFGAGDGYMQPGSMHVGFGDEGVWGADGAGANAAPWLRDAFNGASAGGVQRTPSYHDYGDGSGMPSPQGAPQGVSDEVFRAAYDKVQAPGGWREKMDATGSLLQDSPTDKDGKPVSESERFQAQMLAIRKSREMANAQPAQAPLKGLFG
jgi:hypothetical protein